MTDETLEAIREQFGKGEYAVSDHAVSEKNNTRRTNYEFITKTKLP
jgi:hypothetical protein